MTVIEWKSNGQLDNEIVIFCRVFQAFGIVIEEFKSCMTIINVDGTHIYERFGEKFLFAIVLNTNNGILPLTYAQVEKENNVNQRWFFQLIQLHITGDRIDIYIILDKHASIKHGMTEIWLNLIGYYQYCRHLVSNFNHKFKDFSAIKELLKMFYEPSKHKFYVWFDDMRIVTQTGKNSLSVNHNNTWALYNYRGHQYDNIKRYLSKYFNHVLKGVHVLPVLALLYLIFYRTYT